MINSRPRVVRPALALCLLVLCGHKSVQGADIQSQAVSYTLADLEAMALGNQPALLGAAARVRAAQGEWLQVGLYPNPMIGYMGEEIGDDGTAGMQGGLVSQEIVTAGKLGLNRQVAAAQVRQTQQQLEAERYRVLTAVRAAFYDVLSAQRMIELAGELLRTSEQAADVADQLLKALEGSRIDLLQSQVERNSAQLRLDQARFAHQAAWRRLAAAVGTPDLGPAPLSGDLETIAAELAWGEALTRVLTESPELAAARAAVNRACWAVARAEVEPHPNVNLQAGVMHNFVNGDEVANVQVMVPVPLHDRNQGNIRRAQAELTLARAEVARLELGLQARLANVFERYARARQQVVIYKERILPDARESWDLTDRAYRQGELGYLAVLTAQRTYFQANVMYLEALRELWLAEVAIEGLLLGDTPLGGEAATVSSMQ